MFVICRISHDSTSYRNGHLEGWRHTGWTSIMSAINLVDCYTIHLYPIHLRITLVVNISFFWSLSISYLVGGFNHLEKYESQWEGLSHILWKIKAMFETTNQLSNFSLDCYIIWFCWLSVVNITLSVVHCSSKAVYILYHIIWLNLLIHKAAKYCHHTAMWGWFPIQKPSLTWNCWNVFWASVRRSSHDLGDVVARSCVGSRFTIIHQWNHLLGINQQWFSSCQNDKKKQPTTLWLWLT